jgi:hypothetical protein
MDWLARRVAGGKASIKQHNELKSLQGYFQAELPTVMNMDAVLSEFEGAKRKAESVRKRVERRIKRTKGTA